MKRTIITIVVALMGLMSFAQNQDVMVIEKNDNTTLLLNVDDIKRIVFVDNSNEYVNYGKAQYRENLVTTFFKVDNVVYEVPIEKNIVREGYYRLVNPYGVYYPYNEPGYYDADAISYMTINATDPDFVYVELSPTTMDWGYGVFSMQSVVSYFLNNGYSLEEIKASNPELFGQLKDGVITMPAKSMAISMANEDNGAWYYSNPDGLFAVALPGYTIPAIPTTPEAIDLGLPSGIKWASCNVGATKPEEYGGYYAWGETEVKDSYSTDTYKYYQNGNYMNIGSDISGTEYDVAHVKWGGDWRMPTINECQELIDNCTSEWMTLNGVNGRMFTSNINGNSIFLPATGIRVDGDSGGINKWGRFWSSTQSTSSDWAYCLDSNSDYVSADTHVSYDRKYGITVRPVYGNPQPTITVTTGSATNITTNSATVSGTISGMSLPATATILYGTSSSLSFVGSYITSTTTNSSGSFSINLTGLKPNTTYYYQAAYVGDGQNYMGTVKSFTTKNIEVDVTTGSATNITTNSATVSGSISGVSLPTTATILYGTSSSLSFVGSTITSTTTNSTGSFSIGLTGLKPNTTYYYQAAYVGDGQNYTGSVKSFTTKNVSVTTGSATNITTNSATVNGTISGMSLPATATILYDTSSSLSFVGSHITSTTTNSSGSFSINLTGLKGNTTYYYQAVYVGDGQNFTGTVKSFTTMKSTGGTINGYEYVDLGLPSGLKWATCNVGASSPEDIGSYFAWGETYTKNIYSWKTDSHNLGDNMSWRNIGTDITGTSYDVARKKWGSTWRLPKASEIKELRTYCTCSEAIQNGVNGYLVTGPNGNSIFFPRTGYYEDSSKTSPEATLFWTGTMSTTYSNYYGTAINMYIKYNQFESGWTRCRSDGLTVRPVSN